MKPLQLALPIAATVTLQLFYLSCLARQLPSSQSTETSGNGQASSSSSRSYPLRERTSRGLPISTPVDQEPPSADKHDDLQPATADNLTNRSGGGGRTPPLCGTCALREYQKLERIESVKKMILSKLNLKSPPNITLPLPAIPPLHHVADFEAVMNSMQGDAPVGANERGWASPDEYGTAGHHYGATTQKIFTFAKPIPPELNVDDPTISYFDVRDKTDGYIVSKAQLYYYIKPAQVVHTSAHQVRISRVVKSKGRPGLIKPITVREDKIRLSTRHGDWQNVELTDVVTGWIDDPGSNVGLKIEVSDDEGNLLVATGLGGDEQDAKKPFLQLKLHDARRHRGRREAGLVCGEGRPEEDRCCHYPLRIEFADFQWEWILIPKSYDANYCSGVCPRMRLQEYGHTQIVSMVNPPPASYTGACCSANEMSHLSILYFDNQGDIMYSVLNNIGVKSCTCS